MNDIEIMQYFLQRKADNVGEIVFGEITVNDRNEMRVGVRSREKNSFTPEFFIGIKSGIGRTFLIENSQYSESLELIIKCEDLYVVQPKKKK